MTIGALLYFYQRWTGEQLIDLGCSIPSVNTLLFLRDYLRVPVWGLLQGSMIHSSCRLCTLFKEKSLCSFHLGNGLTICAHDSVL